MLVYLTIQNGFPALHHSHSLYLNISRFLSHRIYLLSFLCPSLFSNMTQFLNKHNRMIYTWTRFFSKEKFTTTIEYLHGNLNEHNLIFFTAKAFVNIYSSLKLWDWSCSLTSNVWFSFEVKIAVTNNHKYLQ